MISFSFEDIAVLIIFFALLLLIGFLSSKKSKDATDYLLAGRNLNLFVFVLVTVSTWYGGILGVGEFTYRYGLLSWFTQGLPYYFFAFLFAVFFAKKIREASLFTIPDKIFEVYGKNVSLFSAVIVFILVSPAPYLLMTATLMKEVFHIDFLLALIISFILSGSYLIRGGFRSNVYVDAFQFFVMFVGFIIAAVICFSSLGGTEFLSANLPSSHLKFTGDASPAFIVVWFLIALWTFADPGFHQRAYAAKNGNIAKWGIIISIFFWAVFDFLTTSTGLFARALFPDLEHPVLAYPFLAEKILSPGFKGLFYAGMFATIISTLNSFLFLSATTIGRDFFYRLIPQLNDDKIKFFTSIGILISGIISIMISFLIPSVVQIWYTIGSLFIPAIIPAVVSAYYPKFRIAKRMMLIEMIISLFTGTIWFFIRDNFLNSFLYEIEPMLIGLSAAIVIHIIGLLGKFSLSD
ncbi:MULTISPECIES: sodium:solute symporter [Ignavibacterium]|jgi:SSS family solute:Na+ symporter|uniref:sodium:solute symporter family protein n=1 Tax=Ignavibacterium TaxID=795750 RepID=UPI0025C31270|nr:MULTISPECIES: sodium:solute symporter family protein [Ignavibacterium]MBI5661063.1 sodium:solute symporter family protein [Ignavibacterium album]